MKKWLSFIVLISVLLGGLSFVSVAQDNTDLVALARYFAADIPFFMAIRTDDDFIASLDAVWARILPELPPDTVPPGTSMENLLDLLALVFVQEDFASGIRPWLGNSVAMVLTDKNWYGQTNPANSGVVFAISIADRPQAETFLMAVLADDPLFKKSRQTTSGDFTVFTLPPERDLIVALSDEVLLIGGSKHDLPLVQPENTLAEDPDFNNLLTKMPLPQYDFIIYTPTSESMDPTRTMSGIDQFLPAYDLTVSTMIGLSIPDGRTVVTDILNRMGDYYVRTQATDPDFLAHVPADAVFVSHSTDLKARFYEEIIPSARDSYIAANPYSDGADDFDEGMKFMTTYLQFMTGLNLDDDILSWMTGEQVFFVTLDPTMVLSLVDTDFLILPTLEEWPFGFGIVMEATDPAMAEAVVQGIHRGMNFLARQEPSLTVSQPEIAGAEVSLMEIDIPLSNYQSLPFGLMIGANDEVFVIGTVNEVQAILEGQGGFTDNAEFRSTEPYMLDNPGEVIYIDSELLALMTVIVSKYIDWDDIVAMLDVDTLGYPTSRPQSKPRPQDGIALYRQLNRLLGPVSLTTYYYEDGNTLVRFVITLDEAR